MRIAVLDDDFILLDLLQATTERRGHQCHTFQEAATFLQQMRRESFDLLIIDWHLPDAEGPDVVRTIRAQTGPQMPILFLTRRQDERDVVEALASGADDFMSKPVRMGEFTARLDALARRAYPHMVSGRLDFGRYRFDPQARTAALDNEMLELTDREYDLALMLFQNAGRLLSREHLREVLWNQVHDVPSRTIDTHISRIRTKMRLGDGTGYTVNAVYGIGYRFEATEV